MMIIFTLFLLWITYQSTLDPGRQFLKQQETSLLILNTNMAMQRTRQDFGKNSLELGLIQQKVRFFESCVSEGLMPKGLRGTFNLAMDVNDEEFVKNIQNVMDEKSSRILVLAFLQTCKIENELL